MVNTLASHIAAAFIIEGTPIYAYGQLASTYTVGLCVYESAKDTWTVVDADTAGTLDYRPCIIGYKERILSTGASSTIDDAYATTDTGVPILIGFVDGYGTFVIAIDDPANHVGRNARWLISETEGVYEALTAVAKSAAGDTEANFTNAEVLVSGDVFMKARWSGG